MPRTSWFWGIAVGTSLAFISSPAFAGHHGSDGGSYGSYGSSGGYGSGGGSFGSSGSSGGSYGSYGSSGGSSRHHHHRHHRHGSSGGGSSGGSSGGYGSGGSSGGFGSGGSSGGSYGSYGSGGGWMGAVAPVAAPVFASADPRGHLALSVPADAIVYLADQQMSSRGPLRNYAVPGLETGRTYRYPIRVEVVRAGTLYRGMAEPQLQAGQRVELTFQQLPGPTATVASR